MTLNQLAKNYDRSRPCESLRYLENVTVNAPDLPEERREAILAAIRNTPTTIAVGAAADRVIGVAEAAERLHVTSRTIFRLCAEGCLERVRLPRRSRGCGIRESSLRALLAKNTTGGAS